MGFTTGFTAVTGATYTAAQFNTYVRDNLAAIWVGIATGDMEYYTSFTTKTRLPIGAQGKFLQVNPGGTAPQWGDLVQFISALKRQGGSASAWDTAGSSNYTPTQMLVQSGVINVSLSSQTYNYVDVTFPVAYSNYPLVLTSIDGNLGDYYDGVSSRAWVQSNSVVRVSMHSPASGTVTFPVHWIAIGPP